MAVETGLEAVAESVEAHRVQVDPTSTATAKLDADRPPIGLDHIAEL